VQTALYHQHDYDSVQRDTFGFRGEADIKTSPTHIAARRAFHFKAAVIGF
jgi:hypothetical protein